MTPPQAAAGPVSVSLTARGYGTPVISTDGNGIKTYNYSLPVVGSTLTFTFDPVSGTFDYTPDVDDRFDFTLEFKVPGQDDLGLPIAQQVKVLPRTTSGEADLVSSTTDNGAGLLHGLGGRA